MSDERETGVGDEVDERSYHDKNLMINWNRETDRCYINTFGTFWHGSFAELLEKLQSVALPSKKKAGDGDNTTSD